jgi:hypothetical protein
MVLISPLRDWASLLAVDVWTDSVVPEPQTGNVGTRVVLTFIVTVIAFIMAVISGATTLSYR